MSWLTGLVSITFRKLTPAEIIGLVKQTPLTSIEWGGDVHVPHGDIKRAAEVGKMTRNAGLVVSAYGSYYGETDGLVFDCVLDTAVALGAPSVSPDERWVAITLSSAHPQIRRGEPVTRSYVSYPDHTLRVIRVPFKKPGNPEILFERKPAQSAHCAFSPTDPNLLYFDLDLPPAYWNGSDGKTPRIWILDISSRNTRPLKKSFPGPFQTHTSWLWDGSALAYHGPLPGGGIYLGITTPDGQTRWEQSFPKARNYGHVAADPSRPALILDGDFSTDRLQWLYYDKPNDGTPRLEPICRHQTEWKSIPGQYSHPHPLADPTGHWIAFNAARRGRSDVFVVDITEKR